MAQRTANIEQRRLLMMQMKLKNREARFDPQEIVDQHRKSLVSNDLGSSVDALKISETPKRKKKGSIFGSAFHMLSGKDQEIVGILYPLEFNARYFTYPPVY